MKAILNTIEHLEQRFINRLALLGLVLLILTSCDNNSKYTFGLLDGQDQEKISIVPLNGASKEDIDLAKRELELFYNCVVEVLPKNEIPKSYIVPGSNKYSSEKILDFLDYQYKSEEGKVLGLINNTISCKERKLNGVVYKNWSILGLGNISGKTCVATTNLKKNKKHRLTNVVIHEIGHTLALNHCDRDSRCLMNDAKGIAKTIDKEQKWMCQFCKNHIKW